MIIKILAISGVAALATVYGLMQFSLFRGAPANAQAPCTANTYTVRQAVPGDTIETATVCATSYFHFDAGAPMTVFKSGIDDVASFSYVVSVIRE